MTSFRLDPTLATEERKRLEQRIEYFDERIEGIISRVRFGRNEHTILDGVLAMGRDPKELKTLGKACLALSEIFREYNDLTEQLAGLTFIVENSEYLASTIGDFDQDLDSFLKDFT